MLEHEIAYIYDNTEEYLAESFDDMISEFLPYWTKWIPDEFRVFIDNFALDLFAYGLFYVNYYAGHIRDDYLQEIQGIADGSNQNITRVMKYVMLPEISRASCSIIGAWGPATASGNLIQVRSLDWNPNLVLNKYPILFIYHPEVGAVGENVYASLSYPGTLGVITGFSEAGVGVGEKI